MLKEDDKKELRVEFWKRFKHFSNIKKLKEKKPGKWIMNDTGIKQIQLKFDIDEQHAQAGIYIRTNNLDKRVELWDKIENLKNILEERIPHTLNWEVEYFITDKRSISRVFAQLDNVNIYNKTCWKQVWNFFYEVMNPIEDILLEYKDYLKYS